MTRRPPALVGFELWYGDRCMPTDVDADDVDFESWGGSRIMPADALTPHGPVEDLFEDWWTARLGNEDAPAKSGTTSGEIESWWSSRLGPSTFVGVPPLTPPVFPSAPGAPTSVSGTRGDTEIDWTWPAPESSGTSPIDDYRVTVYRTSDDVQVDQDTVGSAATMLTTTGLTNGTGYYAIVEAHNDEGYGAPSAASASVTPATVPGAPTIGTAKPGSSQAFVAFTPPASNGGSPITLYVATASPGGQIGTGTTSPITVPGLTNDQVYTFTVRAVNDVGDSAESAASNAVTPLSTSARGARRYGALSRFALFGGSRRISSAHANPPAEPPFAAIEANTDTPSVGTLYELSFDLSDALMADITHPFLYYSASMPATMSGLVGATVYAEISNDGFSTIYRKRAFYSPTYMAIQQKGGLDWYHPTGEYSWFIRWLPPVPGTWQYRLIAVGAWGTETSDVGTFTAVAAPAYKGLLRISSDPRYFEYQDGTHFLGLGVNVATLFDTQNPSEADALMASLAGNEVRLLRMWLATMGVFGSTFGQLWNPSQDATNEQQIGIFNVEHGALDDYTGLVPPTPPHGGRYLLWLNSDEKDFGGGVRFRYIPARVFGLNTVKIPVERSTTYRLRVRYNEQLLEGPRVVGQPYGLVVKRHALQSEIGGPGDIPLGSAANGVGTVIAATYSGATWTNYADPEYGPTWRILEGTYTSGVSEDHIPFLSVVLENCLNTSGPGTNGVLNAGHAFISDIWLEEDLGGGNYGPNLIYQHDFNPHLTPNHARAYAFDIVTEACRANGVYLNLVVTEKNGMEFLFMNADGTAYTGTTQNDNGAYGNGREGGGATTEQRFIQRAWWAYVDARWGWSPAIHSWELLNEGTNSTSHYILADEFGGFMKHDVFEVARNDHSQAIQRHPTTTSFSGNAPTTTFWGDATYPHVDMEKYHQYVSTTGSSASAQIKDSTRFFDTAEDIETFTENRGALTAGGHGKPVIRGEDGLAFPVGSTDVIATGEDDGVWLQIKLWLAAMHPGGASFLHWCGAHGSVDLTRHIVKTTAPTHDYFRHYAEVGAFFADIPLNNGLYQDIALTVTNSDVRTAGQKDTTNKRSHFVAIHRKFTWASKIVADGGTIPAGNTIVYSGERLSGTGTETGKEAGATYDVERIWYDDDTVEIGSDTVQLIADSLGQLVYDFDDLTGTPVTAVYKSRPGVASDLAVPTTAGHFMPGCNVARTSRLTTESAPGALLAEWAAPIEPYVSQVSQPIGVTVNSNKRIFLSTSAGLMAFDATDGSLVWTYETEMPLGHSPTYHDGVLYVGGLDRMLHAIDADTGSGLWTFTTGGGITTNPLVLELGGSPVVFFGSRDGKVYCVYGNAFPGGLEGTERWSYQCPAQVNYSPAYDAATGNLHFAAMDAKAYCLSALTGEQVWVTTNPLPGQGFMSWWPVIHPDGYVIYTSRMERNNEFTDHTSRLFPSGHTASVNQPFSAALGTADPVTGHIRIDARLNDVGGQSLVAYHASFGNKRRQLIVLNKTTGVEQFWDFGNVTDPMPPTRYGKTVNAYPPPIDDNGLLVTRSTSTFQDAAISGALPILLRIGEPYLQYACGPMPGGNGRFPQDEPFGHVIAGPEGAQELHYNYNSDRMSGSIDLDEPNLAIMTTNSARQRRFFEGGIPPASSNNLPHGTKGATPWTTTTSDYWHARVPEFDQHPDSETLFNFHYAHGDNVAPCIFDGAHFVVRSNALIRLGQVSAGPSTGTNAPVLTLASPPGGTPVAATVLTASQVTTILEAEIAKIIAAGRIRSAWYGPGLLFDSGGANTYQEYLCDLWSNPGWALGILLRARPFLSASLQSQLDTYLATEYSPVAPVGFFNPAQYRHRGFFDGTDPFGFDLSTQQTFVRQGGANIAQFGYWGIYKWAVQYGNASAVYNAIKIFALTAPAVGAGNEHLTHRHNAYLAAIYAYVGDGTNPGIWQLAGSQADGKTATLIAHRDTYQAAKLSMNVDQLWTGPQSNIGNQSYRFGVGAWPWMFLTPPLAAYLRTNDLAHTQTMVDTYTALLPYWSQTFNPEIQGENGTSLYQQTSSLFQARAMILQEPRSTLGKYLDRPMSRVGDLDWINNAAAFLEASP